MDRPLASAFERRTFMMMSLAAAAWGVTGCAGKRGKKSKEPESATEGLHKAFGQLKKRVKKNVADKSKHATLFEMLDASEQDFNDVTRLMGDWRFALSKLPPEDRTNRELLVRITEDYNGQIRDKITSACSHAITAREHITEAEWPLVFPGPKKKKG